MIPDQGTLLPLYSRCQQRPRRPHQRWCQPCANLYKSQRYWRLRAAAGSPVEMAQVVIPAPVVEDRPRCLCYRCGMSLWFERTPGDWRCSVCGIGPTA